MREAFKAALEVGTTFFDTGDEYSSGFGEELLGQFRQQSNQPIQIATKFNPFLRGFTAQSVSDALTASLKRLQLERVTLYQLHWPFNFSVSQEIINQYPSLAANHLSCNTSAFLSSQETLLNALADEVQRGRIEFIGVSNYWSELMQEAQEILATRGLCLAVNRVRYSLLIRESDTSKITDTARQLGVTVLAHSALAKGLLTGKYTANNSNSTDARFREVPLHRIEPVISLLRQIGEHHDRTPAQVALNWLIAQGVVAIAGAKTPEQVRENAGALGWRLSDEEIAQLKQVNRSFNVGGLPYEYYYVY